MDSWPPYTEVPCPQCGQYIRVSLWSGVQKRGLRFTTTCPTCGASVTTSWRTLTGSGVAGMAAMLASAAAVTHFNHSSVVPLWAYVLSVICWIAASLLASGATFALVLTPPTKTVSVPEPDEPDSFEGWNS